MDTITNIQEVTITGDGTPINFEISYTGHNLYVNDVLGDSTKTLADTAFIVDASSTGEIAIDITNVGGWWGLAGLAIREYVPLSFDYPPGDFNMDGKVDGIDFMIWQRGESPHPLSEYDYNLWQQNFGFIPSPAISAASAAVIPEPSTLLLASFASLMCCCKRRY